MRVNIYAEELTQRVELVEKRSDEGTFTGVRFYLELPATVAGVQHQGPFLHREGDDDSAAVTFWGKRAFRDLLDKARRMMDRARRGRNPNPLTGWDSENLEAMCGDRTWDEWRLEFIAHYQAYRNVGFDRALEALQAAPKEWREAWRGGEEPIQAIKAEAAEPE